MVNLRWNFMNMITVWLMVGILFVAFGLGKSVIGGMGSTNAGASQ